MHHDSLRSVLKALGITAERHDPQRRIHTASRRLFLGAIGSAVIARTVRVVPSSAALSGVELDRKLGEELDEALTMLAPYAPSYRGGLSNHGPMTAEALVSLGRPDAVIAWVDRYRGKLEARPKKQHLITIANWRNALGDRARNGDWHAWFVNELSEAPWRDVVATWVPRLAEGMAAAGLHGVIRAGHAVRSLASKETDARIDELARALAYWASEFLRLPGKPTKPGKLRPTQALEKVEIMPRARRRTRGLITSELGDIDGFEPFLAVIDLVDPSKGSPNFLAELMATCAGAFVHTNSSSFEFLHAVTGTGAVLELLAFVKPEQQAEVLIYTWQVTAGIYARYGSAGLLKQYEPGDDQFDAELLVQRAVASGDEHTIKLMAACASERQRHPDPRLLAAAAKRILR